MSPIFRNAKWGRVALAAVSAALLAVAKPPSELREALARTPDPVRGATLFETCAACHGGAGEGERDGTVPTVAGQHYEALVAALVAFRSRGRSDIRMEHFADRRHLEGAQDLADVAAHIAQLPPTLEIGLGDGRELARGAALYLRSCAGCHGASGQGDAATRTPRLAGQHFGYLQRQLQDTRSGRRASMLPDHRRLLSAPGIGEAELSGVADYLSRVGLSARAAGT